ncbi:PREDICTED: protein-lysine methyltransferase METTL21E-like [Tauraco erythrolophus]|uniref:protein-lysine methyltransferase METTL21E-like n=1 Tax=Tauraco erythrolophus TaxID=121530 RepID=UPI000523C73A|nr:PREDICTED: protein-lysine methyltransferase METTL21E-like [Tauraco erythrolophus]
MDLTSSQHNHLQKEQIRELGRQEGEKEDEQIVAEIMGRRFFPALITHKAWEGFHFAGHEIRITEATDCYGAVVWPSALVLCYILETNSKQYNLVDKNVIEIGAGTGLVSIVASLLGEYMPLLLCSWKHLSDE